MTLPLSHPEKESAVVGYLQARGFHGIPRNARPQPDAFTDPIFMVAYAAAYELEHRSRPVNGHTIIELIEGNAHLLAIISQAAKEQGRADWKDALFGADNSIAYQPNGDSAVDLLATIAEAAGNRKSVAVAAQLKGCRISRAEAIAELQRIERESSMDGGRLTLRGPLDILKMEFDPADILLSNGYLVKGMPATIVGQGGVGKSRFTMQLAIHCILGSPFIGWDTGMAKGTKWLLLQTENGNRRLKHDLERMLIGMPEANKITLQENLRIHTLESEFDTAMSLASAEAEDRVQVLIESFPADVVVWDVLRDFRVDDLNTDEGMTKTTHAIGRLTLRGNPQRIPLVVHHAGTGRVGAAKAAGWDKTSFSRNSKVLHGWTRAQINLVPFSPDATNDTLLVASGKNNDFPEFEPFAIRIDPEAMSYGPAPDVDVAGWMQEMGAGAKKPKATMQTAVDIVKKAGLDGISKSKLVRQVQDESGCGKTLAYDLIECAENKKAIKRRKSDELYVCP